MQFGSTYRHVMDNRWIVGCNLSIGSASDKPFDSNEEIILGANGFVRIPRGEKNAWLLLLNYSNNRDFLNNIPLPAIAYWYRPSDEFSSVIGIPLFLRWEPMHDVSLLFFYLPIRNVRAQATCDRWDSLSLYAVFEWTNQRYLRSYRHDDEYRLFYFEKRISLGFSVDLIQEVTAEFAGGYAFDRFYFEGEDYGDRLQNRLDVHDGPFALVKIAWGF